MTTQTQMIITALVLAAEIALFILCIVRARKPADPLRPRLIPYNAVSVFLILAIFATIAHLISLFTGQPLLPRRGKGMR